MLQRDFDLGELLGMPIALVPLVALFRAVDSLMYGCNQFRNIDRTYILCVS